MMLKKNFVSGSDKLRETSKGFSHLVVKGTNIKEIKKIFNIVHRRRRIVHSDSKVQENQGAGVGLMESVQIESVQMESESVAHDQQPSPPHPQQNQESQGSMSQ